MSETWTYPAKTPAEIETLAWDCVGGRVFGSWACEPDMLTMCFMILAFMDQENRKQLITNKIAHLYEYMDKASPRSINGYPCFLSANYIDEDDWAKVRARIKQIQEFQKATGPQ